MGVSTMLMTAAYLTLARLLHQGQILDPGIWVNSLVQFQFFALGTMTAVVLRGRVPAIVARPIRWIGLLAAAGVLVIGVGHGLYHHTPKHYAFEAVPALISVIAAVVFVWLARKSEPGTNCRVLGCTITWPLSSTTKTVRWRTLASRMRP